MTKVLIADSGFTKTDWRLIGADGSIEQARTTGINPYYQTEEEILLVIQDLHSQLPDKVDEIYFYGTGCSSGTNRDKIAKLLNRYYQEAKIDVNHDLLAAARSLCGDEKGIACIIGTGTNSCLYDGSKIINNVPSLGWAIADEGGGTYLGKTLVTDYYRKDMPEHLRVIFKERFGLNKDAFLTAIYQEPMPGRFLASFAKFINEHISEPYMYKLVYDAFTTFIIKNVVKYEGYKEVPVHFTGSVAYYFNNILRKVAVDQGIYIKHITEHPIAGLTLFHQ
ncbi:N-acetylglucosamine kinase [Roseivirga seohaensis subsp. aquiponti]|uniref:N-acetylglucosamine kinase n=1 Tax=Roseivirga seohaensis subsp. aquiponti TaxID=1566026 RepID=A0A0L8ANP2_9BACT|nr:N-acetylglucosamine kinase [Roseivirga seohaensis]KOF03792.1 N-acetylglucosamine kinase [Roseivirga seohaensis subsp. aquiponti]